MSARQHQAASASSFLTAVPHRLLQRKCACNGVCAECRDKKLDRKSREAGSRDDSAIRSADAEAPRSPGQPLDGATRSLMEPSFAHDFSQVRVHTDTKAAESAREVSARAFTIGQSIYFDSGEYRPETPAGQRLLAHELAHTIQQRAGAAGVLRSPREGVADESRLEAEADRAADNVVSGHSAPVLGAGSAVAIQRQSHNTAPPAAPPKVVPPVEPSPAQKKVIDTARRAAAVRTQVAMFKARGIQGQVPFQEARELARIKFDWENPNMEQVGEILAGMGAGLITVDVKVAGAGDPQCGSRSGYVSGHRQPIVLCPAFFTDPTRPEGQIRTMIHEMAHVKGIGSPDSEQYFPTFDCTTTGAFESADSWANYVHCLSGQTPDQPVQVKGKVPGKSAGTP